MPCQTPDALPLPCSNKEAASAAANRNRTAQVKPNCVCESTIQTVPSVMASSNGLSAIRAAKSHNQPMADATDTARLSMRIFELRLLNEDSVAGSRNSDCSTGAATNRSKNTVPATITVETK